ncbi:MAG: polysaccharide export protein [Acidobacteriota bacterium]|nr:polysaccharide export protein [Acidobacteriota bacterium]
MFQQLSRIVGFVLLSNIAALSYAEIPVKSTMAGFVLGPDDQIAVRARDVDELDGKVVRIDVQGCINVPLVGRVKASGLTIQQLESTLATDLRAYVKQPVVTVTLVDVHSQTVSVVGAVNTPGVQPLQGRKTLVEALSAAGGLRTEAGNSIFITRMLDSNPIPLPQAKPDASGNFSIAEISAKDLLDARDPRANIGLRPGDVISVPRSELVYVVGAVRRAGGFVLGERANMTVLTALSMAEGLDRNSASEKARIIRPETSSRPRSEVPVPINKLLAGKAVDIPMLPNDILFVPSSAAKTATLRVIEATIQLGTGIAIYRR